MKSGQSVFFWWFLLAFAAFALLDLYLDRFGPGWWYDIDRGVTWLVCAVLAAMVWAVRRILRAIHGR